MELFALGFLVSLLLIALIFLGLVFSCLRQAGPIRNEQMLQEGQPDKVLAFHENLAQSRGTADMVRRAAKAGVPVEIHCR